MLEDSQSSRKRVPTASHPQNCRTVQRRIFKRPRVLVPNASQLESCDEISTFCQYTASTGNKSMPKIIINKLSPRRRRDDMPSPANGFFRNKDLRQSIDPKMAADLYIRPRTGPRSTHLWWPAVAKLQAASVPIA